MDAIQSFQKTVKGYHLFAKDHKLLIAVSGGADSMVLSHICHSLGYDISIAHMNFQLRGIESDEDAAFVERKAKEWNVPFYLKTVDCQSYASEQKVAIQEAARDLRYGFFTELMYKYDYDRLLTAHHARDNVETMLYTLSKGASIKALRGIPLTRDKIARPLLYTNSAVIQRYIRTHEVDFREDSSNSDKKYRRNFIRHDIIPMLENINPSVETTLANTAELGAGYEHLINDLLGSSKSAFISSKKLSLKEQSDAPARFAWLYEHIHDLGFNVSDVRDIWTVYDEENATGKIFQNGTARLLIDRDQLRLEDIVDHSYDTISIPSFDFKHARVNIEPIDSITWAKENKDVIILNKTQTSLPLTLRRWQAGDRFRPSGMKGQSKKIKDYLTDQKISGTQKRNVEVLVSGDEIIWVVGYRKAHGFKNDNTTAGCFSLQIKKLP